jgi:hypothetical protein
LIRGKGKAAVSFGKVKGDLPKSLLEEGLKSLRKISSFLFIVEFIYKKGEFLKTTVTRLSGEPSLKG